MLQLTHYDKNWRNPWRNALLIALLLTFLTGPFPLIKADERPINYKIFPVSEHLRIRVDFWKLVFLDISSKQGFLHDPDHLNRIYESIKFTGMTRRQQSRHIKKRKRAIKSRINRILAKKGRKLTKTEQQFMTNAKQPSMAELRKMRRSIRFQRGMSDRFIEGYKRSMKFIDRIRAIFAERGLPLELAFLPHVESSFNYRAYSKVGAAGIWQFMRYTGRRFMKINYIVDQRRDPIIATVAASKLLKMNYKMLKSWPLAIIAYNHGAASMKRAIKKHGTRNIDTIIRHYTGRRFGFASKNFYPSFMAAVEIASNPQRYLPNVPKGSPLRFTSMKLPGRFTIAQISRVTRIAKRTLQDYNLALRPTVFRRHIYLPKNYALQLPMTRSHTLKEWQTTLAALKQPVRSKPERGGEHIIQPGESLFAISRIYKVRLGDLIALNKLDNPSRIWAGKRLAIPGRNSSKKKRTTKPKKKSRPIIAKPKPKKKTLHTLIEPSEPQIVEKTSLVRNDSPKAVAQGPETRDPHAPKQKQQQNFVTTDDPIIDQEFVSSGRFFKIRKLKKGRSQITVETDETIGHYAEWLDIRASDIRRLNRFRYSRRIGFGSKLKLMIPDDRRDLFQQKRLLFHSAIEEDFFSHYRVVRLDRHIVKHGDTLIDICKKADVPTWLLRRYRQGKNNLILHRGEVLTIPRITSIQQSETVGSDGIITQEEGEGSGENDNANTPHNTNNNAHRHTN